jgi:CubicO group peptidase (beta-lactamase class C family)
VKNLFGYILLLMPLQSCDRVEKKPTASQPPAGEEVVAAANSKIPPRDLARYLAAVKSFVDSSLKSNHMNGSILVAKNGQIIYEQYPGYRNPRQKTDSITANTPFHLASVSKTFTGMAVLKLWETGKLDINDTVSKYLPGFPCVGVTIKTLLNHRSGIPKYDHYMENLGWDKRKMVTNQDVLDFIIANYKRIPIGRPDRGFSYSNTNFALLALIIEKASGMSYKDYMKQTFFDPLGMKDTYVFTVNDTATYLSSYYYSGRPYKFDYLDLVYGDKNIYSTVQDLLKWDQSLHNDSLFKKETLDAAYSGYSFEKAGTHNYGLGWRMYLLKNGKKLIYHNGWWHGNRTAFYRLLDENVTIIALCNNDYRMVYKVKEMADIFGDYMQSNDRYSEDENGTITVTRAPVAPVKYYKRSTHKKRTLTVHKKKTSTRRSTAKK